MSTLTAVLAFTIAATIGAYCGWSAFLRRTSGPRDGAPVRRFVFCAWLVTFSYGVAFVFLPETYRDWLVIPLMMAGLFLIFRFRRRRREVRSDESFLDPQRRDGSWIQKVR